jgi:very-short-patch-repair endonuclease
MRVPDEALATWLETLPRGKSCALFCDDLDAAIWSLDDLLAQVSPPRTVVTLDWPALPRLADELESVATALGAATVSMFPPLYATADQRRRQQPANPKIPGVFPAAERTIVAACQAARPPDLGHWPFGVQVRQLVLAIDPQTLVLLLLARARAIEDGALLSFARGSEWLAAHGKARVLVVLPAGLADEPALEIVRHRARYLRAGLRLSGPVAPIAAAPDVSVSAVLGRPHRDSEGEQRLSRFISDDPVLAPLFRFNQVVATAEGAAARVDLLWPEGRLVIKVDGYPWHSRRAPFFADRDRDFHLLASGYRVWRVDESEILDEPERVVGKLRQLVRVIGAQPGLNSASG